MINKNLYIFKNLFIIAMIVFLLTGCKDVTNKSTDISYNTKNQSYASNKQNEQNNSNTIELPPKEVASFYTNIYDKSENRMHNLRVAANNLSNTVIKSGETFSFNETMGQSTEKKGYKKAKILDADGNTIEGFRWRCLSN